MNTHSHDLPLHIDVHAVKQMLDRGDDFLLLDCREPDEYAKARIEGAVLLPMSQLRERWGELEAHRHRHIVVHCHHGGRSQQVTQWLRRQQFPRVQNMAGGIDEWSQAIDPSVPRY